MQAFRSGLNNPRLYGRGGGSLEHPGFATAFRVAQKSKPLSRIIITSYLKSSIRLDFLPILILKWAQEYYMFVLNTLCMTWFVTSSEFAVRKLLSDLNR